MREINLYSHNQETYEKVNESFKTKNKVAIVQATGTGKGYIILKYIQDNPFIKKVILAPSHYILNQLENEYGSELPNTEMLIYPKLLNMKKDEIKNLNAEVIILDEFHRCGAKEWGLGVSNILEQFPDAKVLGTSATPIRFLDNKRDMADELFDGNVVSNLDLNTAIIKNILPMPKYIGAIYSYQEELDKISNKLSKSNLHKKQKQELDNEVNLLKSKIANGKGIDEIFKKHLEREKSYKFIVFCKDVNHLEEIDEVMTKWFSDADLGCSINTYKVFSENEDNHNNLKEFVIDREKSIDLLLSINMFNEGIHLDNVSGVILFRPTTSPIIYYQQIGRAIQVGKNERPIIFDLVNNFDNIYVEDFIDGLKKTNSMNNKDVDLIDEYIDFSIIDEVKDIRQLFEEINLKILDTWTYYFNKLSQFTPLTNIDNVGLNNDKRLQNWVSYQRHCFANDILTKERKDKLNSIDFIWEYDAFELEVWNNYLKVLKTFKKEFGHVNPSLNEEYCDIKLGTWCTLQRNLYRKDTIGDFKIKELENIGFIWNMAIDYWFKMYDVACDFQNEYGHTKITAKTRHKDESLGSWWVSQKQGYTKNRLDKDKIKLLEKIGMVWNLQEKKWNDTICLFKNYLKENGHLNIKTTEVYQNKKIGNIVLNIRKRKNTYSKSRISQLEEIGFVWEIVDKSWDNNYMDLKKFMEKEKRKPLRTSKDVNEFNLSRFISNNNQYSKNGKLSERKKELIEDLGIELAEDITDIEWHNTFNYMKTDMNSKSLLDIGWRNEQRKLYKNNKLQTNRVNSLKEISFNFTKKEVSDNQFTIKKLMENNNVKVKTIIELLGITKGEIANWRNLKSNIPKEYINQLSELLKVDAELIQPQEK